MTADEIRRMDTQSRLASLDILQEIAAQLAEQTEQMREDRILRTAILEEQRADSKKRDSLLATSAEGIEAFRKSVEAPPAIPPRLVFPSEVVHLGCLLREPDGTFIIASEIGRTQLEPEEAQRILALITPPPTSEAKPQ